MATKTKEKAPTQSTDFRFSVRRVRLKAKVGKRGRTVPVANKWGILREDTEDVVAVVGEGYSLAPHGDVVDYFEDIFRENNVRAKRVKTFVLQRGATLYARYLLPEQRSVENFSKTRRKRKGDFVQLGFVLKNSLDGSSRLRFSVDAERLVCSNGMVAPVYVEGASMVHRGEKGFKEKCSEVPKLVELFDEKVLPAWGQFIDRKVDTDSAERYFATLNTANKHRRGMHERFLSAKDMTFWGLYNAVTAHITHEVQNVNFGTSRRIASQAFRLLNGGLRGFKFYDPEVEVKFLEEE